MRAGERINNKDINNYHKVGVSLGGAIAVAISWSINKSIAWAILHGVFGWLYVLWFACGGGQ